MWFRKTKFMRRIAIWIIAAFPLLALAGTFDDKSIAYFTKLYGPAKSSNTVKLQYFAYPHVGGVPLKGSFSVREFHESDLIVQPVFFLPSLQIAAVRLQLNRDWTPEQIDAALAAYGGEWKAVSKNGVVSHWVAPDGAIAIKILTWIDINSKAVVDLVEKTIAEDAAKRKAIPKF